MDLLGMVKHALHPLHPVLLEAREVRKMRETIAMHRLKMTKKTVDPTSALLLQVEGDLCTECERASHSASTHPPASLPTTDCRLLLLPLQGLNFGTLLVSTSYRPPIALSVWQLLSTVFYPTWRGRQDDQQYSFLRLASSSPFGTAALGCCWR